MLLFTITVGIRIYYKYHFDREFINSNPSQNGNTMCDLHCDLSTMSFVVIKGISWLYTAFIYNSFE